MKQRKLKAGEVYVLFGGEVRTARTFPTLAAAELARGGEQCWQIVVRPADSAADRRRGYVTRWETIIVLAVKRQDRHDRTYFTWTDEKGEEHQDRYYTREGFPTFAEAKAFLVARAEKEVVEARAKLSAQRVELRAMRALKPFPGIAGTT